VNPNGRREDEIREIVDRETRAWDARDVELLLSIFHTGLLDYSAGASQ
jgi:hypothetical protein